MYENPLEMRECYLFKIIIIDIFYFYLKALLSDHINRNLKTQFTAMILMGHMVYFIIYTEWLLKTKS